MKDQFKFKQIHPSIILEKSDAKPTAYDKTFEFSMWGPTPGKCTEWINDLVNAYNRQDELIEALHYALRNLENEDRYGAMGIIRGALELIERE